MNMSQPQPELVDRPEPSLSVELDKNTVFVIAGAIALEAIGNKILVLIDKFKSGYECKDCNETGTYQACACLREGREFGVSSTGKSCTYRDACAKQVVGNTCNSCKGTGTLLTLPQNARAIPTSGVIVSKGPDCTIRELGERVLFGAHTGYFLPFKGSAKIRCLREDEPLCVIHTLTNNQTVGDFMQLEEPQS